MRCTAALYFVYVTCMFRAWPKFGPGPAIITLPCHGYGFDCGVRVSMVRVSVVMVSVWVIASVPPYNWPGLGSEPAGSCLILGTTHVLSLFAISGRNFSTPRTNLCTEIRIRIRKALTNATLRLQNCNWKIAWLRDEKQQLVNKSLSVSKQEYEVSIVSIDSNRCLLSRPTYWFASRLSALGLSVLNDIDHPVIWLKGSKVLRRYEFPRDERQIFFLYQYWFSCNYIVQS